MTQGDPGDYGQVRSSHSDQSNDLTNDHGQDLTAEAGAWLTANAAITFLDIAIKTLYRRVKRGEIKQRKIDGGRVLFWIPGAHSEETGGDHGHDRSQGQRQLATTERLDPADLALALYAKVDELAERKTHPLHQVIREQAEEIGRLREVEQRLNTELEEARARRPWWRFWN